MFAGKSSISKICKMHFRTFQIVYNNCDKRYHDLLNFSKDVSIHQKHLLFFCETEVCKSVMNINPGFMWEFFNKSPGQRNLQKGDAQLARSPCYGINSLAFCGSLLQNRPPSNVI